MLGDDGALLPDLREDAREINRLVQLVRAPRRGDPPRAQDLLLFRVWETRRLTARVEELRRLAAAIGDGVRIETDPALAATWRAFHGVAGDRDRGDTWGHLDGLHRGLDRMRTILAAINGSLRPRERRGSIPARLLTAAGNVDPLRVLERAVAQEPDPDELVRLLEAADVPSRVPDLMAGAAATDIPLLDALRMCRRETIVVDRLFAMVVDSGRRFAFFEREGGRTLNRLIQAASVGARVWGGATLAAADIHYGTAAVAVDFAYIRTWAEPLPPLGQPLGPLALGRPDGPRFIGGATFHNDPASTGMVLPVFDANGRTIDYREYDIRPYPPPRGRDRGEERVVEGDDGRHWYTDDHYRTFWLIA